MNDVGFAVISKAVVLLLALSPLHKILIPVNTLQLLWHCEWVAQGELATFWDGFSRID